MGDTTDTKCCARVLGGGADFLSHHVRSKQKRSCAECWCIHVPGLSGMTCTSNINVLLRVIVLDHNGIQSGWSGCATSTENYSRSIFGNDRYQNVVRAFSSES